MEAEFRTLPGLNLLFTALLATLNLIPDQLRGQLRNAKLESDPARSGTFTRQYRFVSTLDGAPEEERGGQIGHAEGVGAPIDGAAELPHTIHWSRPVSAPAGIGLIPLIPLAPLILVIAAIAALAFVFGPVLYKIKKVSGSNRLALLAAVVLIGGALALGTGLFKGIQGGASARVQRTLDPDGGG